MTDYMLADILKNVESNQDDEGLPNHASWGRQEELEICSWQQKDLGKISKLASFIWNEWRLSIEHTKC